jgi:hypothetical protein
MLVPEKWGGLLDPIQQGGNAAKDAISDLILGNSPVGSRTRSGHHASLAATAKPLHPP